jgi:UDP-2,3-diacylglucosamine hydrolase
MNLLILSDLHLGPASIQRNQQFIEFLKIARDQNDELLIVGDLFDLWLGWPNLTMEFQRPILQEMSALANSGLAIDYVEGNRDFGISEYKGKIFRSVQKRYFSTQWHGKKIYAEHGDLINTSDRQYRLWRSISKSAISYFLIRNLPSFATLSLALRLERGMKTTNLKNKMRYPENHVESFYLSLFESGMDIVVVGHFHAEKAISLHLGKRNVLFYNLPGWEQGFRYLVIPPDGAIPYFKDWGKENGNSTTS